MRAPSPLLIGSVLFLIALTFSAIDYIRNGAGVVLLTEQTSDDRGRTTDGKTGLPVRQRPLSGTPSSSTTPAAEQPDPEEEALAQERLLEDELQKYLKDVFTRGGVSDITFSLATPNAALLFERYALAPDTVSRIREYVVMRDQEPFQRIIVLLPPSGASLQETYMKVFASITEQMERDAANTANLSEVDLYGENFSYLNDSMDRETVRALMRTKSYLFAFSYPRKNHEIFYKVLPSFTNGKEAQNDY